VKATAETFAAKQDGFEKRKEEAAVENEHGAYHTPAPSPSALASVPSPTAPAPPNVVSAPAPSHHSLASRPIMGCDRKTSNCSRKERQRRHEQSCRDKDKAKQQSDDGDGSQHSNPESSAESCVEAAEGSATDGISQEGSASGAVAIYRRVGLPESGTQADSKSHAVERNPDIAGGDAKPSSEKPLKPADAAGIDRPQPFDEKDLVRNWMPYPGCGDIVMHTYHALVKFGEQAALEGQQVTFEDQQFIIEIVEAKQDSFEGQLTAFEEWLEDILLEVNLLSEFRASFPEAPVQGLVAAIEKMVEAT